MDASSIERTSSAARRSVEGSRHPVSNAIESPEDGVLHVIDELLSPPEAMVWTMWCGAQCVAFEDGSLIPNLDFYTETWAERATCEECKRRFRAKDRLVEAAKEVVVS